jgi:ADP-dependent NAD(P)H-hydrate dehydratase / NAD(P)H-hydrate epimerase
MTELLTAAQMRAIEQAAIASGEVTGLELMERAGQGVVEAIFEEWPELKATSHRAVVLCGPGNNGGDGFVVARLLHDWGWQVEVFLYGDPLKLPPDAKVNYERWLERGEVKPLDAASINNSDIVVDALFGTGLTRAFECPSQLIESFHELMKDGLWWSGDQLPPYVVAVDNVSTLDADSGRYLGEYAVWANEIGAHLTVTFHRAKVGHHLDAAPLVAPKVVVCDIGLGSEKYRPPQLRDKSTVHLIDRPEWDPFGPSLEKGDRMPDSVANAHKYSFGHALIVSGPSGKTGAARLAARGALRIGAGLVSVACEPEALAENAAHLTAIMLRDEPLTDILQDERINALCIGPGLGVDRAAELIAQALGVKHTSTIVLDADALTALSRDTALFALLKENCVVTPHAGEFARLFPDIAKKLAARATTGPAYSKVDATRDAAKRAGCVVLFKGPDTVIADPDGRCSINSAHYDRTAPWLATAGSGDVLAGFITGLLARGFAPMQAAETAAWLHVECALSFGPGLIAEDLPEELPKVFRKLRL